MSTILSELRTSGIRPAIIETLRARRRPSYAGDDGRFRLLCTKDASYLELHLDIDEIYIVAGTAAGVFLEARIPLQAGASAGTAWPAEPSHQEAFGQAMELADWWYYLFREQARIKATGAVWAEADDGVEGLVMGIPAVAA